MKGEHDGTQGSYRRRPRVTVAEGERRLGLGLLRQRWREVGWDEAAGLVGFCRVGAGAGRARER